MLDIGLAGFDRWPPLAGFREAVERYQFDALTVAAGLLRAIAITLDVDPSFFADRMHEPQCFLRMLRYPAGPDGVVATGQHTDYGAITLLATDGAPGLEVRARDGSWGAVEAPAGSLVVNLGDMLARWTNDRYLSTPHRVIATGGLERCSIPFFVNPDPSTEVACIASCVTPDRPCRYRPIRAVGVPAGPHRRHHRPRRRRTLNERPCPSSSTSSSTRPPRRGPSCANGRSPPRPPATARSGRSTTSPVAPCAARRCSRRSPCSAPWPPPRRGSSSARWSPTCTTARPPCWPSPPHRWRRSPTGRSTSDSAQEPRRTAGGRPRCAPSARSSRRRSPSGTPG